MIGIGVLKAEDALACGVTGPMLRASGVAQDLRKTNPYCGYETYDFDAIVADGGDCYDRYQVRVAEMRESRQDLPSRRSSGCRAARSRRRTARSCRRPARSLAPRWRR